MKTAHDAMIIFFWVIASILSIHSYADSFTPLHGSQLTFKKTTLGTESAFNIPLHIFSDQRHTKWFIFEQYIVKKQGNTTKRYALPGNIADYLSNNPSIRSYQFFDRVIFSYNKQVIHYDEADDRFVRWHNLPLKHHNITGMSAVDDKQLWITTLLGVYTLDSLNGPWQPVVFPKSMFDEGTPYIFPYTITPLNSTEFVIGSGLSKLYRLTLAGGGYQFKRYDLPVKTRTAIRAVSMMSDNTLLLATSKGLMTFDLHQALFTRVEESFGFTQVTKLVTSGQRIWLIADHKLYSKLFKDKYFTKIDGKDDFALANKDYQVTELSVDREGSVWVSVENHGIYYHSMVFNRFNKADLAPGTDIDENLTFLSFEDDQMILGNNKKTHINAMGQSFDIKSYSALRRGQSSYFLGLANTVVAVGNQGIKTTYKVPALASSIPSLATDSLNRLWAVSQLTGLYLFDLDSARPIEPDEQLTGLPSKVKFVSPGQDNTLTLVSATGLRTLSVNKTAQRIISQSRFDSDAVQIDKKRNRLFIYHKDLSVSRYNLDTQILTNIRFDQVQNSGCVYNEGDSIWWVSQVGGNLHRIDTSNGTHQRFSEKDGLPDGGLNGVWCDQFRGQLYFSSYHGFVTTTDSLDKINDFAADSFITHLVDKKGQNQLNQDQGPVLIGGDDFPLDIGFYNASHAYPLANKNHYRLAGLNNEWINLNQDKQTISYQTLNPGDYTFKIQGSNSDGLWGKEATLKFTVLPRWWQTWWARTLCLLAFCGVFYLFYLIRTQSIRKRATQLENTVAQRTAELAQILDKKHQEFATVSHEFRTPLTLVLGPVEQLLRRESEAGKRSALQVVKRNGNRLLRMVDQLLHMEKLNVEQVVARHAIRVEPIARFIVDSFAPIAQQKNIRLTLNPMDDLWLKLTPDALEKMLLNLLSNAIKYTLAGGYVGLHIKATSADKVKIMVSDTGVGIAKSQQSLIFERFSRVCDTHSEQITGAGIGLALVKNLVVTHQGSIEVESDTAQGATFSISLPRHHPDQRQSATASTLSMANSEVVVMEIESLVAQQTTTTSDKVVINDAINRATLLIVEDNADMADYIKTLLIDHYDIHIAYDGRQGLAMAINIIPDLIISDVIMPKMDGFTLCWSVKDHQLTSHIPLILLSARSDRDARLQGWKNQADEYLAKPFDAEELNQRIENLLSIRQLLKQRFYQDNGAPDNNPVQANEQSAPITEWAVHEQQFMKRFEAALEQHLDHPDLKVETIAKALAVSQRQLYRKLKGLLNVTPADHLRNFRLKKAMTLIKQGEPIGNIALTVGFTSHSYFSRCFKARYGATPSAFTPK
ncbi:MAG: response regulator [Algicola sp.]|nr:response regulator [Algicola sp.]